MMHSIWLFKVLSFCLVEDECSRSCFLRSTHAVLCRSPEREGRKQRDGVGDWVIGLFFCLMMEAVNTIWIPMNDNGEHF